MKSEERAELVLIFLYEKMQYREGFPSEGWAIKGIAEIITDAIVEERKACADLAYAGQAYAVEDAIRARRNQ